MQISDRFSGLLNQKLQDWNPVNCSNKLSGFFRYIKVQEKYNIGITKLVYIYILETVKFLKERGRLC